MKGTIFAVVFCVFAIIEMGWTQLVFSELLPVDKEKSNLAGRIPLYSPSRCKQYELLYPGDQVDDWICDCEPASLYYPDSDACHPAFRRGPCEPEQMLVLAPNKTVPQCIHNACKIDGQVMIYNVCYEIGRAAPCQNAHLSFVLGVDPKTLMLDCVKLTTSLKTRTGLEDDDMSTYDLANVDLCARGTKRAIQGTCKTAAK